MGIINFISNLFKPMGCNCQCHLGGYSEHSIIRGGIQTVSCEHCLPKLKSKKVKKWGTAVPNKLKKVCK